MLRFSVLLAMTAMLLAIAASAPAALAASQPLARDSTSAPRLEQRRRDLLETGAAASSSSSTEPEFVNALGAVGEAFGEAFGEALSSPPGRKLRRKLRGAELFGEAGEAWEAFAGEAVAGRR